MNKVIVAGSINMDIITRVAKLPQKGETIHGRSVEYLPGGKGLNQAVACGKMGIETVLVSRLGNDAFAGQLLDFLEENHIDTAYLQRSAKESGTAFITVDDKGQNTIIVVPGSNADVGVQDISRVEISKGDVIICQFEIPLAAVEALFAKAKKSEAKTILNPSPVRNIPKQLLVDTDILIINETELGFLSGQEVNDETPYPQIRTAIQKIKTHPEQVIIVTLGHKGALIDEKTAYHISGHQVEAIDTMGAGDCFAGVIASQLFRGKNISECVALANKAASICVTRKGAAVAMPSVAELDC